MLVAFLLGYPAPWDFLRKSITYSGLALTTDCLGFTTYNLDKVILILLFKNINTTNINYENSCC